MAKSARGGNGGPPNTNGRGKGSAWAAAKQITECLLTKIPLQSEKVMARVGHEGVTSNKVLKANGGPWKGAWLKPLARDEPGGRLKSEG